MIVWASPTRTIDASLYPKHGGIGGGVDIAVFRKEKGASDPFLQKNFSSEK